jgi:hypothetical protein
MGRESKCCQALERSPIGIDLRWWRKFVGDEIGLGNEGATVVLSAEGEVELEVLAEGPIGTWGVSGFSI